MEGGHELTVKRDYWELPRRMTLGKQKPHVLGARDELREYEKR